MRCARASSPRWFKTQAEARIAVFEFIEGFYNPRRRHSSIGYLSPLDYERRHAANPDAHQPAAVLASVKDKPFGRPPTGPSLTAAARDGRTIVRAGMKEWLRQGPNKRMTPDRRAKCRQTRYPDPKPSTVHQTGASPPVTHQREAS
jgi:hypothetical protein